VKKILKVGIIGGGASGMMCAATIIESNPENLEIHLFDKNPKLGVKVAITGGGRCNLTTGVRDIKKILSKYIRGANFVKAPMLAFTPEQVREWFNDHGVPTKIEEDARIFPKSNRGEDVVTVFEKILDNKMVKLYLNESVVSVTKNKDKYEVKTKTSKTKKIYDKLVITTGGAAYQNTGSTGDGYELAKSLGHSITKLGPSLNSFTTQETWCHDLAGISLPEVRFEFQLKTGERKSVIGPMIFTHFGISGPAVFGMAAQIAFEDISEATPFKVKFIPDSKLTFDVCNNKLLKEIPKDGTRALVNVLKEIFIPKRMAETILALCETKTVIGAELLKEERLKLVHTLTGELEITLIDRMAGAEFVTAGGVTLEEVDRRTMESKINNGLYFAGEVLNIDALTGGYNLQSAWATGRAAGKAIIASK
jgi:predicted Rossmann fold flavoprotein